MAILDPILTASPAIQLHVVAALVSVALTPVQLWRRKRGLWHRRAGYIWAVAMMLTALSSFWIHGTRMAGPFGPIHLLSIVTLLGVVDAIRRARRRDLTGHAKAMRSVAFWGLGVAGTFTFLPGRLMSDLVFGPFGQAGFVGLILVWAIGLIWQGLRRREQGMGLFAGGKRFPLSFPRIRR